MRFFSNKSRPFHLGPFPLEKLVRTETKPSLSEVPETEPIAFSDKPNDSLAHAIARYLAMLDTVRDGRIVNGKAQIPEDPNERSKHLKAACYYFDASMVGIARLEPGHFRASPIRNPMIDGIREELERGQPMTYAAGVDAIYSDILESSRQAPGPIDRHTHAIVMLVEFTRDPEDSEPGTDWIIGTQKERAALLAANTAVVIANYIRMLGYEARAHTLTTAEVDLNAVGVSSGLCGLVLGELTNAYVGSRFGLAVVTTSLELEPDLPLGVDAGRSDNMVDAVSWRLGVETSRQASTAVPFSNREFRLGPHPFETIKRVDQPTTFIDEDRVPRFPKRADFFARALFGDMGPAVQDAAKGGHYVIKSPIGACARRALGALLLLQFGEARGRISESLGDARRNADNVKAAAYYLSTDAVGISRAPDWSYYSHNAGGNPIAPYHDNAISMLFDQGFETMEGASGDDWISVAQSMRAYLRFSLIGGVVAEQIRRLGYSARVHSVLDSEVLQPPLLLLSGLGEVSRIGEVILNPFLGPRLKAGTVTTSLPMEYDKPIDFGLQHFCQSCNKCARECPSGAITAGPKLMYNGYEIWKSDAEKCARYRLTNKAGGMCGRCMKTCPWNLEGLFSDASFRWMAINAPFMAKTLAKLDDQRGRGKINPVKKWWWDIELDRETNRYVSAASTNERGLNPNLKIDYADQTLAVYPADTMPRPYPVPHLLDREEGIRRYRELLTPSEYKRRISTGDDEGLAPGCKHDEGTPPVFPVVVAERQDSSKEIVKFELRSANGNALPEFEPGAHIDVVIAPEYLRQFSLAGDPADNSRYVIGLKKEEQGRGGSVLMYKAFRAGKRTFVSPPRNHFPLDETADFTLLMAGGIGVTPLIAMAHRLHSLGREFLFHYSAASESECGFVSELREAPWSKRVFFHFSREGTRARLDELIPPHRPRFRLYACGSDRYMDAVFDEASDKGWPEDDLSREYFSVPELPERENFPFKLVLARKGISVEVGAEQSAVDALAEVGIQIDTKCSDGLCGVCSVNTLNGEIDHRDFVLSKKERGEKMLLCSSRARDPGGEIEIDL